MRNLMTIFILFFVCVAGSELHASETVDQTAQTRWLAVMLGGRKIGHVEILRQTDGNRIITTQTLSLTFNRAGKPLQLSNMSRSIESIDGLPQGFAATIRMSAKDSMTNGRLRPDGKYHVVTTVGGHERESTIEWPDGGLLAEGQRQAMLAAGRVPGTRYELRAFDPSRQQVVAIHMQVIGDERVNLPEGTEVLSHQRQIFGLIDGKQGYDLWLDHEGMARKGSMTLLGGKLEMLGCSKACALAANQDVDMFRSAMVGAPRPLTSDLRNAPLRYRIYIKGEHGISPIITTDEQRITSLGKGSWQVDVGSAVAGGQSPPVKEDVEPNDWLQSDAPEIRALAKKVAGPIADNRKKMRRLRSFVSDYIDEHGLDVGYASALEVLHNRRGDCTEYAVLLAALARAQNIPTRVISGMTYADRYAGASRVFLPHQWVQAWIDGRWESYDAASRRFDTSHIALASGDGEPWNFYQANQLFGDIHIIEAKPVTELFNTPIPEVVPIVPTMPLMTNGEG